MPDRADLAQVHLVRCQPPLRVQREPDVGQREQVGVLLGLGEEVGPPGLQVEDDGTCPAAPAASTSGRSSSTGRSVE